MKGSVSKMRVSVKKINLNDIMLSRAIAKKMSKILTPQFGYIVESDPEVNFFVGDRYVQLNTITFESLECEDRIRIDEELVVLELGNGMHQILFMHEGFGDLLRRASVDKFDPIEPEIQQYLEKQREYYAVMC